MNFTIHAPGRVNLLGEHTDYNGLPVLPAAIPQGVTMEGESCAETIVTVRSAVHDEEILFALQAPIPPHPQGHWANYVKAGMQGVLNHASPSELESLRGCKLTVHGNIPQGVGLSSSSALVIASALALLQANRWDCDPLQLAERMAEAEQYVGTRGGGMDQATCLLGRWGHILKIDFFPLQVESIPFPDSGAIVVCDSGIRAKKSENALQAYNLRALECRLGNIIVQRHLQRRGALSCFQRIGCLRENYWNLSLDELRTLIAEVVEEEYDFNSLRHAIQDDERLYSLLRDYHFLDESIYSALRFACGKRLRHVVSDAQRVERSRMLLQEGNLKAFGELMTEGHRSARDDFEISCTELDDLVQIAQSQGALGSRLTGAGFGGCTVHLVRKEDAEAFCRRMGDGYDSKNIDKCTINAPFVIHPSEGARVIEYHL